MTVTALSSVTAPSVAAVPTTQRSHHVAFGHSDDKKDSVELSKDAANSATPEDKPYTFGQYLWKPGSGFGNIVSNLVVPNRTLISDLIWGMALPPFTLIIPVIGIIRAIKKASDAKKLAAVDTDKTPTAKAPTAEPEPLPVTDTKPEAE